MLVSYLSIETTIRHYSVSDMNVRFCVQFPIVLYKIVERSVIHNSHQRRFSRVTFIIFHSYAPGLFRTRQDLVTFRVQRDFQIHIVVRHVNMSFVNHICVVFCQRHLEFQTATVFLANLIPNPYYIVIQGDTFRLEYFFTFFYGKQGRHIFLRRTDIIIYRLVRLNRGLVNIGPKHRFIRHFLRFHVANHIFFRKCRECVID